MGVGDISKLSGVCVCFGPIEAGGEDGRGAGRVSDVRVVCGCTSFELGPAREPSGDGVGVSDGTWNKHGIDILYREGT